MLWYFFSIHWQFCIQVYTYSEFALCFYPIDERDETVSDTAKSINLLHMIKVDSDMTSSHVSQSVPQSGLIPVLAKYKKYLQSCYNARVLAPADKYLPTRESPYINLAMIRRGCYNHKQRNEFNRRTLHGGIDQILQNKTPINIEDLLTPENSRWPVRFILVEGPPVAPEYSEKPFTKSQRPIKFILVEGPPGIGKSTFAWEVCRRWDEIESLRNYHTVVLLKLREKWVLNATSLPDLFRYEYDPDMSKCILVELAKTQGSNLLLVLDGFDEVSHSFHENSVIKSILCRQLLPECTIILTTTPVAKATLMSICQPRVDKHVEIIGFKEEERVRYITEVFSKEPELQINFLKYMFHVPHIKSMMYIPLNCAIIAQVYYESQSSRHLAIPRTRTQLYKALTHSLLVRHMKMKESKCEYTSMLPEGLNEESIKMFKTLAKFAFDTYHEGKSRKVTFFKEDIPEGLVHFGFMNESTEMYAGKGVEQTFSFLHLSLQEYLAAWHLADSYSIEFQVAYHRLAVDPHKNKQLDSMQKAQEHYKGDIKQEEALLSSLQQQESSLVEPAIFLAGITGWRCKLEDDRNHWEMYLSHDTARVRDHSVLLKSVYEAQNPTLLPHYYASESSSDRKNITIGSLSQTSLGIHICAPYDIYALSFCLAHSSNPFSLSIGISKDDEVSLVEIFCKGLNDHCKSATPRFTKLMVHQTTESEQNAKKCLFLLTQANCWTEVKEVVFCSKSSVKSNLVHMFLKKFVKLQRLFINIPCWEWLPALKSLSNLELQGFHISNVVPSQHFPVHCNRTTSMLDAEFPYDIYHSNVGINSLLNSAQKGDQITKMTLYNISRGNMASVRNILLHCPSLVTMELKRTRLGYDGILYICSALRNNTTLSRLAIDELPPFKENEAYDFWFNSFSSMERVPLPGKTTCTDLLLELNNILKDNTTLEKMKIQTGLFLPLSAGKYREYCQWTGLGPLQQFNVGAVGSGMSPNLRRSFSSSDLTQPQTTLFWKRGFKISIDNCRFETVKVDFKTLFTKRKKEGKKLFSLPSFTAPDTEVLQSFSGLDPRLKECLELPYLHQHIEWLGETFLELLDKILNEL